MKIIMLNASITSNHAFVILIEILYAQFDSTQFSELSKFECMRAESEVALI